MRMCQIQPDVSNNIIFYEKTIHIEHTMRSNDTSPGLNIIVVNTAPSVNLAVMHTKETW